MDKLSESLAASFQISTNPNDTVSPHPRLSDYKVKPSNVPDQQTRRQRMLEEQKSRRQNCVNYVRRLVEGEEMEMEENQKDKTKIKHEFECFIRVPNTRKQRSPRLRNVIQFTRKFPTGFHWVSNACDAKVTQNVEKSKNPYKNQLMLSEWLVDIPEHFEHEWFMVISPIGKRCLVVASKSTTAAYTKSGYCVNRFPSLLPGGCKESFRPSEYTILDCIYSEIHRTFYILDVMCWRGHPVYDSETEFRFYWLKTKLEEHPDLLETSKNNPYKFVSADLSSCDQQSIYNALLKEKPYQVDGVLFYHKQAHYHPGNTPLVGWLKVYMIPELIGMDVPPRYLQNVPDVHKLRLVEDNEKFRERAKSIGEKKELQDENGMEVEQHKTSKQNKQKKSKGKQMIVDESIGVDKKKGEEMQKNTK